MYFNISYELFRWIYLFYLVVGIRDLYIFIIILEIKSFSYKMHIFRTIIKFYASFNILLLINIFHAQIKSELMILR
jgi:hypothetical protein